MFTIYCLTMTDSDTGGVKLNMVPEKDVFGTTLFSHYDRRILTEFYIKLMKGLFIESVTNSFYQSVIVYAPKAIILRRARELNDKMTVVSSLCLFVERMGTMLGMNDIYWADND